MKDDRKKLVVFFSAQQHTKAAAEKIAHEVGADLFEIRPAKAYASADLDWTDGGSRVSREHSDPSLREVELAEATPAYWAEYDVIFLGYPIWWGMAAWPVSSFVRQNDFTSKTVLPFGTSYSSPLGDSDQQLASVARGGDWHAGRRFSSDASLSDIQAWLREL